MKKLAFAAVALLAGVSPGFAGGYTFLNIGINLLNQDRYADSVPWFDKALAAGDLNLDQRHVAFLDRGRARDELGDYAKSAEDYTAALAIRPDGQLTLMLLAYAHAAAGDNDQAALELAEIKKKGVTDFRMLYNSGLVEWALARYPEAGEDFEAAAKEGYTYAWLWEQLANLKQGKPISSYHGATVGIVGEHRRIKVETGWPGPILDFYQGNAEEKDVFVAADNASVRNGPLCEANFYVAEWHLLHGDSAAARPMLEKSAEECPSEYEEKRMSRLELKSMP